MATRRYRMDTAVGQTISELWANPRHRNDSQIIEGEKTIDLTPPGAETKISFTPHGEGGQIILGDVTINCYGRVETIGQGGAKTVVHLK